MEKARSAVRMANVSLPVKTTTHKTANHKVYSDARIPSTVSAHWSCAHRRSLVLRQLTSPTASRVTSVATGFKDVLRAPKAAILSSATKVSKPALMVDALQTARLRSPVLKATSLWAQ